MLKVIERYIFENKDEWKQLRKGLFTASRINEIMANGQRLMTEEELKEWKFNNPKSKAKYTEDENLLSDGAISYILDLIQNIESEPKTEFYSQSMEWGVITEPEAAIHYCNKYGYDLNSDDVIYTSLGGTVFFVGDNVLGCTPDLILPDRIAQFKCPDSDTHLEYILFLNADNFKEKLPKYYDQIQTEMMLCERYECDFYSFDPRFKKEALKGFKVTLKADKERQNQIYKKVLLAEKQKQDYINQLNLITNGKD